MAQDRNQTASLSAAATVAVGTSVIVSGYRHLGVSIFCDGGTATVKIRGASATGSTLSSAAAIANQWDYVGAYDLEDGAFSDGDTGWALTSGDCRNLAINTDGLYQVALEITARSGSTVTGYIITLDNE